MKNLFLFLVFMLYGLNISAQSTNDYRVTQSGNWNNIAIWQRYNGSDWVAAAQVPTNSDGVITIQNGYTVTVNDSRTADQVVVEAGATLNITSGTFTIDDGSGTDLVVYGTLNLSATISGTGQISINGTMNWTSGYLTAAGTLTIQSSGALNISGTNDKNISYSRTIENYGNIYWTGGDINFSTTSIINNQSGGNFYIQTNNTITDGGYSGTRQINNYGSITRNTATGTATINVQLNNSGNVNVTTGTLNIAVGTQSGTFNVSSGATLGLTSYVTVQEGASFSGAGTYQITGNFSSTGTTNGLTVSSNSTLDLAGGTILGGGKINLSGTMNWNSGNLQNGELIISSGATLNITGSADKNLSNTRYITNYGTINWTGGNIYFNNTSILNNQSGSSFYIATDNTIYNDLYSGTRQINNYGFIAKSTGSGTTTINVPVNNYSSGTIEVASGTLYLVNLSNFSSGTLNNGKYGVYSSTLKYGNSNNISTLNAELTLYGTGSQILNNLGTDALASLSTISSGGKLTFENGRNYSVNVSILTNNGTTKLDGSNLTIPSSYSFVNNGSLIFNSSIIDGAGNFTTNSNSTLEIDNANGISSSGTSGNIQNAGTRTFSTSANYTYKGATAQITGSGLPSTVNNLTINNSHTSGVTLTNSVTVNGNLTLNTSDLSLNGNTITLGNTANLIENPGKTVIGTTGKITTTRTFNAGDLSAGVNIAGLGAKITTDAALGSTTIERMHNQAIGNSNTGIYRIFKINPTNNTGLNATLEFYYDESELDGKNENNLKLFKSLDGTDNSWNLAGGTVDVANNKVTLNGIISFSYWTLGVDNNPLPVELVYFQTEKSMQNVILKWQTATEINNYGFEIERKLIGKDGYDNTWKKVGFVQGNGTTNITKEYSFIDENVISGKYKYRLKQIDNDGAYKYSDEIEVEVIIPKEFVLYQNYPNPFNPTTTITFTLANDGITTLKVYDILGREVQILVNEHLKAGQIYKVNFDAGNLSSGIYYYKLENNNNRLTKKFILAK